MLSNDLTLLVKFSLDFLDFLYDRLLELIWCFDGQSIATLLAFFFEQHLTILLYLAQIDIYRLV